MARSPLQVRRPHEDWVLTTLTRRTEVCRQLVADAEAATDPVWWAAVRRQSASYLRHLDTWAEAQTPSCQAGAVEHRRVLAECTAEAESRLSALDDLARADITGALGLRLAVIGKGGVGKTVICATLARLLGRRGQHRVLVADLDANPGLAYSLGVRPSDAGLPVDALEQHPGASYGWHLAADLSPTDVVECLTDPAPDGVRVMGVGKVGGDGEGPAQSVVAVNEVLLGFGHPGWHVIADLEAGPTTPYEGFHGFAEQVALVVGPTWASTLTARRLAGLVGDRSVLVVANRVGRDGVDHDGQSPIALIPSDPRIAHAERLGLAPLDVCPDSPAVAAIADLAQMLVPRPPPRAAA